MLELLVNPFSIRLTRKRKNPRPWKKIN